jgi:hypothetical protein
MVFLIMSSPDVEKWVPGSLDMVLEGVLFLGREIMCCDERSGVLRFHLCKLFRFSRFSDDPLRLLEYRPNDER